MSLFILFFPYYINMRRFFNVFLNKKRHTPTCFRFGTLRLGLHAPALLHLAKFGQKLAELQPQKPDTLPSIEAAEVSKLGMQNVLLLIFISNTVLKLHLYLPRCLGQETAKRLFGLRVQLPPAQCPPVYHSRWRLHTVLLLNIKQKSFEYQFL